MVEPRVKTGIKRLDNILKGGFPRGSTILLAGGPGTGKTILSAQFIYIGAKEFGDKGVYVSFTESATALKDFMLDFGWNFDDLEKMGVVSIVDLFTTSKEGLDQATNTIMDAVGALGAKRLVIDSITAMSISLGGRYEVRNIVHLLQKLLKQTDCTTLLVAEVPWGGFSIGSGIEEFVVDGVILMETRLEGQIFRRQLAVLKMRGTEHEMKYYRYEMRPKVGVNLMSVSE